MFCILQKNSRPFGITAYPAFEGQEFKGKGALCLVKDVQYVFMSMVNPPKQGGLQNCSIYNLII